MIRGDWTTPELEYLANNQWEFTEKVDGTNIRVELRLTDGGNVVAAYRGRTDNAQIPKPLLEYLEETFPTVPLWRRDISRPAYEPRHKDLGTWMINSEIDHVILFGEGYGPNIQGGGKYREDTSFVLFDVKIGDWWLSRENVDDVACKLGIESVPVIGSGTLHDAVDIVSSGITFDHNGVVQRWYTSIVGGLESRWGPFEAEGIVARPVVPLFDRKGQRIITKIKSVDFN
jgi:hypothetical protein